jgi:hypothetical protein
MVGTAHLDATHQEWGVHANNMYVDIGSDGSAIFRAIGIPPYWIREVGCWAQKWSAIVPRGAVIVSVSQELWPTSGVRRKLYVFHRGHDVMTVDMGIARPDAAGDVRADDCSLLRQLAVFAVRSMDAGVVYE